MPHEACKDSTVSINLANGFPIPNLQQLLFPVYVNKNSPSLPPPHPPQVFKFSFHFRHNTRHKREEDVNSARNQLRTCRHVRCHISRSESKSRRGRRPESLHGRPAALRRSDSASLLSMRCGQSGARGAAERFEASGARLKRSAKAKGQLGIILSFASEQAPDAATVVVRRLKEKNFPTAERTKKKVCHGRGTGQAVPAKLPEASALAYKKKAI